VSIVGAKSFKGRVDRWMEGMPRVAARLGRGGSGKSADRVPAWNRPRVKGLVSVCDCDVSREGRVAL